MGNYYSYMRISTKEERGKQKFTRQEKALEKYAADNGIEYLVSFREDVSGKNFTDRAEWRKLERIVKPGDTIVFKDISRFTREAENGYSKYMELLTNGVELVFLDNQTVSTAYIKQLLDVAQKQQRIAATSMRHTVELLLIVELDRVEQERLTFIKRVTDGIKASSKASGRSAGTVDKLTPGLQEDIAKYFSDRSVTMAALMKKHGISRNTLKKYIKMEQNRTKNEEKHT